MVFARRMGGAINSPILHLSNLLTPSEDPPMPGGRPSKLNTTTKRRILSALRKGSSQKRAAAYGGISEECFYKWMRKGEAAKSGEYLQFYEEVKRAQEEAHHYAVSQIQGAMDKHWQAAAWYLERKAPEEYGRHRAEGGEGHRVSEVVVKYVDKITKGDGDDNK